MYKCSPATLQYSETLVGAFEIRFRTSVYKQLETRETLTLTRNPNPNTNPNPLP